MKTKQKIIKEKALLTTMTLCSLEWKTKEMLLLSKIGEEIKIEARFEEQRKSQRRYSP